MSVVEKNQTTFAFDVVALGEAMVELYLEQPLYSAMSSSNVDLRIGGDMANALIMLSRLGANTAFITRFGDDPFGTWLTHTLSNEGVTVIHDTLPSFPSGIYLNIPTEVNQIENSQERRFFYWRKNSGASQISRTWLEKKKLPSARFFLSSGITLGLSESLPESLHYAFKYFHARGSITVFDINYRPLLWTEHNASSAFQSVQHDIDYLMLSLPNDWPVLEPLFMDDPSLPSDPLIILNHFDHLKKISHQLLDIHTVVAIRLGAKGVFLSSRSSGNIFVPALKVKAIDTSGAGDAWLGAFLYALSHNTQVESAARFATQVAALKVQFQGAVPDRKLFLKEVRKLYDGQNVFF